MYRLIKIGLRLGDYKVGFGFLGAPFKGFLLLLAYVLRAELRFKTPSNTSNHPLPSIRAYITIKNRPTPNQFQIKTQDYK